MLLVSKSVALFSHKEKALNLKISIKSRSMYISIEFNSKFNGYMDLKYILQSTQFDEDEMDDYIKEAYVSFPQLQNWSSARLNT